VFFCLLFPPIRSRSVLFRIPSLQRPARIKPGDLHKCPPRNPSKSSARRRGFLHHLRLRPAVNQNPKGRAGRERWWQKTRDGAEDFDGLRGGGHLWRSPGFISRQALERWGFEKRPNGYGLGGEEQTGKNTSPRRPTCTWGPAAGKSFFSNAHCILCKGAGGLIRLGKHPNTVDLRVRILCFRIGGALSRGSSHHCRSRRAIPVSIRSACRLTFHGNAGQAELV